MMWAFNWQEYQVQPGESHTRIWRPLWDSINLCMLLPSKYWFRAHANARTYLGCTAGDFAVEIGSELAYFGRRLTGRHTSTEPTTGKPNFGRAFGVDGYTPVGSRQRGGTYAFSAPRLSYDDDIRLAPYTGSLPSPDYDDVSKLEASPRAV